MLEVAQYQPEDEMPRTEPPALAVRRKLLQLLIDDELLRADWLKRGPVRRFRDRFDGYLVSGRYRNFDPSDDEVIGSGPEPRGWNLAFQILPSASMRRAFRSAASIRVRREMEAVCAEIAKEAHWKAGQPVILDAILGMWLFKTTPEARRPLLGPSEFARGTRSSWWDYQRAHTTFTFPLESEESVDDMAIRIKRWTNDVRKQLRAQLLQLERTHRDAVRPFERAELLHAWHFPYVRARPESYGSKNRFNPERQAATKARMMVLSAYRLR